MAENRPDPYVKKDPGNIIRSGDWNELQVQAREEIRDKIREHLHTGGEEGNKISREAIETGAIDGDRIDPSAEITVKTLTVSGSLKLQGDVAVTKLSNDETLASDSDGVVPTEHAVKAYVDNTVAAAIPRGVILMWSGTTSEIPSGYALCDGQNGTPDLSDRFVLSIDKGENPGERGGSHELKLKIGQLPSHNHGGWTLYEGKHRHTVTYRAPSLEAYWGNKVSVLHNWGESRSTSEDGNHHHQIQYDPPTDKPQKPITIKPKFYKIAFIMKL